MATLNEYYLKDFSRLLSSHKVWTITDKNGTEFKITAKVHLDFDAHVTFISYFVPSFPDEIDVFSLLLTKINDALDVVKSIQIKSALPGENEACSDDLKFSGKVSFYYDGKVDKARFQELQAKVKPNGVIIHYRDQTFSDERSKIEKPLAFISHDTRDKEAIAGPIVQELQKRMCWVWYDEYSLQLGDSLRESIEKGLKECKKCVLILSPNFLSNSGWTKTEFNTIFTREIIETKNLVLPIWAGVTKKDIFEYCPTLVDRVSANWDKGLADVVTKIHRAVISDK